MTLALRCIMRHVILGTAPWILNNTIVVSRDDEKVRGGDIRDSNVEYSGFNADV